MKGKINLFYKRRLMTMVFTNSLAEKFLETFLNKNARFSRYIINIFVYIDCH